MSGSITVAASAGFCFGVRRAAALTESKAANSGKTLYMLGELIHNRDFNERLATKGVKIITPDALDTIDPASSLVFIRAHGERADVIEKLNSRGIPYTDATCPYVNKIHQIVSSYQDSNTLFVIIGKADHPEVTATASFCKGEKLIAGSAQELKKLLCAENVAGRKIIAVCQTTHSMIDWRLCSEYIRSLSPDAGIYDTVCRVTEERQNEISLLAKKSDAAIIIGGKNSANTNQLYNIASRFCKAYHIENANELKTIPPEEFRGKNITITAGASTPEDITQEVIFVMSEIIEDVSFADMLNDAFKTVHTGERVTGTVSMVSPAEIHVDLGTKHTGIMPYDEAVTDSSVELEKEFHVGDKVDVVIVKFNDSEGTVLVSKKRFDADKNWNSVQEASAANEILTGKVKEAVKGGLIINYTGLRVFVPASQSGLPRDADLSELVGKEVPFRIIETDPYKKRVIASIRSARRSLQKQQAAHFYETAQPGDKIHGTVRSLTSFGAFVDLGGVDGMIHITELSWGRLRNPADVLKIGDEVDVYIKDIDKEKKRISLGYKTEETNPWNIFIKKYKVGDVVTVKIASILSFGAFGTIIDGVDGLIHISQIAPEPVQNIKSVLKVGDEVDVKITGINEETHKINLSRRAVLADLENGVEAEADSAPTAEETKDEEETENN